MEKRTIVLFFALALSCAGARASTGFHFQAPPGWLDLSPSAPAANFARLPPDLIERVRAGHFAFYAVDVEHAGDGFMENVNVQVEPGADPITSELLRQLTDGIQGEVGKQFPGMTARITESSLVSIGGVTCGRWIGDLEMNGIQVRQIGYVIPGDGQHAILTYSTTPGEFARYQSLFDAAARATTGAVEPLGFFGRVMKRAGSGAVYGALFGLLGALAALLVGRGKKQ